MVKWFIRCDALGQSAKNNQTEMGSWAELHNIIGGLLFTRHSYEITPQPTAMDRERQRDILSLLEVTKAHY